VYRNALAIAFDAHADMAFFASATWQADFRAWNITKACRIASFALSEFFVDCTTDWTTVMMNHSFCDWLNRRGGVTFAWTDAHASAIHQVAFSTETADYALERADWTRFWIGTSRFAS
jgi:hypothetical protein